MTLEELRERHGKLLEEVQYRDPHCRKEEVNISPVDIQAQAEIAASAKAIKDALNAR